MLKYNTIKKLPAVTALLLLSSGYLSETAFAQQADFKPYSQAIPGTELSFDLVPIPSGEFLMGSPKDETAREKDESPQHPVQLSPFWMAEYEITWDIFELFAYKDFEVTKSNKPLSEEVDAMTRPTKSYLDMTFGMGKAGKPAISMTQYAAIQFCKWLYKKTGVFYRLPTEAEWEYACRAGSKTAYSFGDDASKLSEYAWYAANSEEKTHTVGTKKPNAWGLYDMHGNVMEWTADQYLSDFYEKSDDKTVQNPLAEATELYPRAVKGGSYIGNPSDLRSANRIASQPKWKEIDPQVPKSNWWFPEAPFLGFRVVRPLQQPSKAKIEAYYNKEPLIDF